MPTPVIRQSIDNPADDTFTHLGGVPLALPVPVVSDAWPIIKAALEGLNAGTLSAGLDIVLADDDDTLANLSAIYDAITLNLVCDGFGQQMTLATLRAAVIAGTSVLGREAGDFAGKSLTIWCLATNINGEDEGNAPLLCAALDADPASYGQTSIVFGFLNAEVIAENGPIMLSGTAGEAGAINVRGLNACGRGVQTDSAPVTPADSAGSKATLGVIEPE